MDTEILIIGSGTGEPSLKRASPGLVIKTRDDVLLIDPGSGTLRSLLKLGINYLDITQVYITHFHPDHTLDLISLFFVSKNPRALRENNLYLIGPDGIKDFCKKMFYLYPDALTPESYKLINFEVSNSKLNFNSFDVVSTPTLHTQSSVAFRFNFEDGGSVLYSGDTDYCKDLIELARGCDYLILECSFPEEYACPGHLSPSKVSMLAEASGCKKVILTHMYPICDRYNISLQCKKMYSGQIIIANDFYKFTI